MSLSDHLGCEGITRIKQLQHQHLLRSVAVDARGVLLGLVDGRVMLIEDAEEPEARELIPLLGFVGFGADGLDPPGLRRA